METLEAVFKVVTPLFMSGADQNEAELRVPSIKGMLRFWWRASWYGKTGNDVKTLHKVEADIFGSTQHQSKLIMDIVTVQCEKKLQKRWQNSNWQAYVGYGLADKADRKYIFPGEFKILINCRNLSEEKKQSVINAIQLWSLLGGLGARSRKGWGSIALTNIHGWEVDWNRPGSINEYKKMVMEILNTDVIPGDFPTYTSISKNIIFKIGPEQSSSEEAHRHLVIKYKENVKKVQPKQDRGQFGLPRGKNQQRRASPLFLHVHQLSEMNFLPVAFYLPSQFLPDEQGIPGGGKGILDFLNELANEGTAKDL